MKVFYISLILVAGTAFTALSQTQTPPAARKINPEFNYPERKQGAETTVTSQEKKNLTQKNPAQPVSIERPNTDTKVIRREATLISDKKATTK